MGKFNYNYGKIIDGNLIYAPRSIPSIVKNDDGDDVSVNIYNPSDYIYRLNGYKAVTSDQYPDDGKIYEPYVEEVDGTIYKHWSEVEPEPTESDRFDAIEAAIVEIAEAIWGMSNG